MRGVSPLLVSLVAATLGSLCYLLHGVVLDFIKEDCCGVGFECMRDV